MRRLTVPDYIALAILVIGGINWGLVGIFQFDLVAFLFGGMSSIVSRIVYTLVGISAVYVAVDALTFEKKPGTTMRPVTHS